jgi:hypothetical protein
VTYVDVGGASRPGIGGLNISIGVLQNILYCRGFMPRNRRVKYFHRCTVEYIVL